MWGSSQQEKKFIYKKKIGNYLEMGWEYEYKSVSVKYNFHEVDYSPDTKKKIETF